MIESLCHQESNTGKSVSVRDVNGGARSVPLYKVSLLSDVVSGEVVVGVVSSLPMKGDILSPRQ